MRLKREQNIDKKTLIKNILEILLKKSYIAQDDSIDVAKFEEIFDRLDLTLNETQLYFDTFNLIDVDQGKGLFQFYLFPWQHFGSHGILMENKI